MRRRAGLPMIAVVVGVVLPAASFAQTASTAPAAVRSDKAGRSGVKLAAASAPVAFGQTVTAAEPTAAEPTAVADRSVAKTAEANASDATQAGGEKAGTQAAAGAPAAAQTASGSSAAKPVAGTDSTKEVRPISVSATPTPGKVKLGEPFTYQIVLTHPKDQRYELLSPKELGPFELTEQTRHRVDGDQSSTTTFDLKMSLFALGEQPLPAFDFEVTDPKGVHRFTLHEGKVEGLSTLPKDADQKGEDLFDIKPNAPVPVRTWRLLWALLGLAVLVALGWFGWRAFRRLRERALIPPPVPPRPLHERTIEALDALKGQDLPGQGQPREFYFRLSEILRGYLGERFRFEALECTSSELLLRIRELPNPKFPVGDFSNFVHESDLVKFAKLEPEPQVCAGALELAYRVVHLTHPPAVTPAADALGPDVPQS